MKSILFIILILSFFNSTAQTYYSFPVKNTIWSEMYYKPDSGDPEFHCFVLKNNDTIINGKVYHKLYHSTDTLITENNFCGGLREENKKIYYYSVKTIQVSDFQNMYIEKDTEVMLYDFSIKIGDTIKNDVIRISHLGSIILYRIDSVLIGNNYRKSFLFGLPGINNASPMLQWIEGIGYLRGLLFATGDLPSSGLWNNVICLTQENQETYHSSKYKNCFYKNTDAIIYPEKPEISLYPNPIDKLSELKFPEYKFKKAVLYNINGSLIKEFDVQGKKSIIINKNSLPSGIYLIRLIGPRNTFTIKVIFK